MGSFKFFETLLDSVLDDRNYLFSSLGWDRREGETAELDASDSLLGFILSLDSTLSAGGGHGGVDESIVLSEGDARLENFRILTEEISELLGKSLVELLVSAVHLGQVEGEGGGGELVSSMGRAYEGEFHFGSLAVLLDSSLESVSDRSSALVGIKASLFNSHMLLGEDFHLISSSSGAEHLGGIFDLIEEFARRLIGSSDDGSGACDTTGHTLGHTDEGHGG